jgi:hypothetical protein
MCRLNELLLLLSGYTEKATSSCTAAHQTTPTAEHACHVIMCGDLAVQSTVLAAIWQVFATVSAAILQIFAFMCGS